MKKPTRISQLLTMIGYIGMILGAIDPMEGSVIILPGSALVLLGHYLAGSERPVVIYHSWVFVMIMIGVAALWGFSIVGGIGGESAYSMWWGLTMLPYPVAWSVGIWAPGSPRWVLWSGIVVSAWYMMMFIITLTHAIAQQNVENAITGIVIGIIAVLTTAGCIYRLRRSI